MVKGSRTVELVLNGARKPVSEITDRAKRYRANTEENRPGGPELCAFCGASPKGGRPLDVDHIDGHEAHGEPENLQKLCRRCNTAKANAMARRGLGRKTAQYNPSKKARRRGSEMDEYAAAIKIMRGEWDGDVSKAVATIRATPARLRSQYTSKTWGARKAIYGPSGRQQRFSQDDVPF